MIPGVSVIICCYNSENKIKDVLNHLEKQKDTERINWEIIVVDNASSDKTSEVARKSWTRKDIDFKVVYEEKPGLSNARLKGLETSVYEIIVFVDDDNLLDEQYISGAYNTMISNRDIGLAGGLGEAVSTNPFPDWFQNYLDVYAVGPQAEKEGYLSGSRNYLHGAGIIMRKDAWDYLINQGFSFMLSGRKGKSMSSGEDSEISSAFRMAGFSLWYNPELKFEHVLPESRISWDYVRKLSREFGKSFVVLDIYLSEIQNFTGWKRTKSHNWLVGTLICFYQLFRLFPHFLWLKINYREGNRKEFEINYQYGILMQRFKLLRKFSGIREEIIVFKKRLEENPYG